ncbi:hypothetical protein J2X07_000868 [Fictibacillus barbaricus]|uniref:Uncharacterized protein n=1 Tax=Fictibacillus barbaricus TaxID=182136 RepID=A0ABU1TXI8_9BACL|nr:hypothetical protein [Fictibacillus barbaricus]
MKIRKVSCETITGYEGQLRPLMAKISRGLTARSKENEKTALHKMRLVAKS